MRVKTPIRAAFAALCVAVVMNPAAHANDTNFFTPKPAGPTAADQKKLDDMFAQSTASLAQRAAEKCDEAFNGKEANNFANKDLAQVINLDQLTPKIPAEIANKNKITVLILDRQGYTVCYDNRMPKLDVAYSVNFNDRVIGLNPESFSGPPPLAAQQMAFAAALSSTFNLTKGFTALPSTLPNVPNELVQYVTIPFVDARNPKGNITANNVRGLSPSPIKGAQIPYEIQKALDIYQV